MYLASDCFTHIVQIEAVGEIDYARYAEAAAVGEFLGGFADGFTLEQDLIVLLNENYVGVKARNPNVGVMFALVSYYGYIQLFLAADVFYGDRGGG